MSKKESRLSPEARRLLEDAKKVATKEEAVRLLKSVNPQRLTMYDRQKIGREILAREKIFGLHVGREYDLHYRGWGETTRENMDTEKRDEFSPNKKLKLKQEGDRDFKRAQELEQQGHFLTDSGAIRQYISAGMNYELVGMLSKALKSYEKAMECPERDYKRQQKSPYIRGWWHNPKKYECDYEMDQSKQGIARVKAKQERIRKMKSKSEGLEGKTAGVTVIIGLIGGLFFLSTNITGNVIGLNQSTGNILGAVLLCVGLVGSFFWFRSRKK